MEIWGELRPEWRYYFVHAKMQWSQRFIYPAVGVRTLALGEIKPGRRANFAI